MKSGNPEAGVLPSSGGSTLDKDGINDSGYIDKKGTHSGESAMFNYLPPGMNIDEQKCADIRSQPIKFYKSGLSYPDDGGF